MSELPVTIFTPESAMRNPGLLLVAMGHDIVKGRELAWRLFMRDLSAQYRQTYLGYIWAFMPPFVASGTFIFLQSQGIISVADTPIPYAAFAMIGTLLWQSFVDAMQCPLISLQNAQPMLAKINFPREAILMAGLLLVGFNFLVRLLPLILVMAIWRVTPNDTIVLFPVAVLGLIACGFAVGLVLLPIGALYRDIGRGIGLIAQFWMLLTPVVYPTPTHGFAGWLATWNPIAPVLATARETVSGMGLTAFPAFIGISLLAVLVCFLGMMAFRLVMPILIERMSS